MLNVIFLGTVSGIPSLNRHHPAIIFEHFTDEREVLLFDCGENAQRQIMKSGVSFMQINKIFITHWHADHFAGLIPMIQTMNLEKRKAPLTIFAPEAERFVSNIMDMGYFGLNFPVKAVNVDFEGEEIKKIDTGPDYEIYSVPVLHTVPSVAYCFKEKDKWNVDEGKLKALGFKRGPWVKKLKKDGKADVEGKTVRLEDVGYVKEGLKVVYSGDTEPCDNVLRMSKDASLLIHDGTFVEEDVGRKAHASVEGAATLAKKAGVKNLVLTHISRRYQDTKEIEEKVQKIFPGAVVAKDMMKVTLKNDDFEVSSVRDSR
jgi:ribonuclease Z